MIKTVFLYSFVLIAVYWLANRARKTEKSSYLIFIILILALLAGLRSENVGKDTQGYVHNFELVANGQFDYVWGVEYSFKVIMLILSRVFKSYTPFLIFMAFFTNVFIIMRLWDFRNIIKFEWAVVIYYVVFYFFGFNIMRQMCAVALVFWGTRFIEKGKYIYFLLTLFIAYLFHTSALIGVVYLLYEYTNWKTLSKKKRFFLIVIAVFIPTGVIYVAKKLSVYLRYFSLAELNIGPVLFVKLVFFVVSLVGLKKTVTQEECLLEPVEVSHNQVKIDKLLKKIEIFYVLGLLISMVGYIVPYADRMSLYFYLFECVYMGILVKYKSMKSGYSMIIVLLYGFIFINMLRNGGQGQIPYIFFWQ